MFYPTYSKSPGLCSVNIIKSPIQFVYAGVLRLFFILNAFNCGFLPFCFKWRKHNYFLMRLHPIVGSNDPKPDPIYASLRLAFHLKCVLSARKCITHYRLKFQIIHFFFWIRPCVYNINFTTSPFNVVWSQISL